MAIRRVWTKDPNNPTGPGIVVGDETIPDPVPQPRTASLEEIVDAIPDARYTAWQASATVKHVKYWNVFHSMQSFTPREWDAWGDKFRTEGLFVDDAQRDTFKAAKPVG